MSAAEVKSVDTKQLLLLETACIVMRETKKHAGVFVGMVGLSRAVAPFCSS